MNKPTPGSSDGLWLHAFKVPPPEFRPIPFWSWNEVMEPSEVRRQVDLIADAGWGGAFVHARIGLITPYLGEEWFNAVDAAIDQSRIRGLKVWLYDEDKWPSGFSGGSVPLADESFRMKSLLARRVNAPPPAGSVPIGPPIDGLQVYAWTSPLGYDWFNGTCYVDLLNRDAVRKFIDDAYEPYFARYGKDYGKLVVAAFTDEPCPLFIRRLPAGSVPFTPAVIEEFKSQWNYDPTPELFRLFVDDERSARFRLHYYRSVNALFERNFTRQIADWCNEHDIALTGHFLVEGSLYDQQAWGARIMPNYRHFGIPGVDLLGRQIDERITAKQCHSVANQFGKKRMMCELYGVTGGSLSFEDRWWIACQQICLGVNLLVPHLALYTMAGCRKRDYPQNIFHQQPWWPLNHIVDLPLSRLCVAMSHGKYHAEALVIHPQESAFALWRAKMPAERSDELVTYDMQPTTQEAVEQIEQLDRDVKAVMDSLLAAQRTFDFGDEQILADAGGVVKDNNRPMLRVGEMDYPAVVLPSMYTMANRTFQLLRRFQSAGGRIVRCGEPPKLLDGEPSEELQRWLDSLPNVSVADLPETLAAEVEPAVQLAGPSPRQLYVHVRDLDANERLIMFTNLDREEFVSRTITFRGDFASVEELDLHTGQAKSLVAGRNEHGALIVDLTFSPTQTRLLRLTRNTTSATPVLVTSDPAKTIELPATAWTVERLDDNAMTLDYAFWRQGSEPWSSKPAPVIAIQKQLNDRGYDGPLTLRYDVNVGHLDASRRVHLVVEYPDRYRISVNGRDFQYSGLPCWRDTRWLPIDISGALSSGRNSIELHCDPFQHGNLTSVKDQFRRYGTEIESIYLVGDFSVETELLPDQPVAPLWSQWRLPPIGVRCFTPNMKLVNPTPVRFGDVTAQGLPFYADRLRLTARLPEIPVDGKATIRFDRLDGAVAEVSVDGTSCGYCMSHPLEVPIRKGRDISITLYGTLRNLLGPHHHADGELPAVGPDTFLPTFAPADPPVSSPDWLNRWMAGEVKSNDWSNRYCMVTLGDLGRIELCLKG